MPPATFKAWAQIHFCVLLWGFTAILGKLISLPALSLVWWRMAIVTALLLCWPPVWRGIAALPTKLIAIYSGIGILIALHWLAFYSAIKLSNASVAATCIATAPVFLAWIEPLLTEQRFRGQQLLLGVAAIPAVALVVNGTPSQMHFGIVAGVIAALLVAAFGALNKRFIERADALTVTGIEIGAGAIFLTLLGLLAPHVLAPHVLADSQTIFMLPNSRDALLLATLSIVCTLLPVALSLVALRHLTAFGAQFAVNLEPVYAVLLAIPLLGEQHQLNWQFYSGVSVLVLLVFLYAYLNSRRRRDTPVPNIV